MSYKKESNGTWTVWFGKRHPKLGQSVTLRRKGLKTEAEARKVERELILAVEARINSKVSPTWSMLIQGYLEDCKLKGHTLKTRYNAEKCLRAATFDDWGNRIANEISTHEIRALICERMADKSETHRKAVLKFIRGTFTYGVEAGLIDRNPAPSLRFKTRLKLKHVLTEAQAQHLLAKALEYDWEWYPHVATALYTGMRNGELYALRWSKVNFDLRQIAVDTSWNNKDGFKSTKSGNERIVEIADELLEVLRKLKLQSAGSEFVLPRVNRWSKGEQARELRIFTTAIGLPPIRFHDLRATFATLLLNRGIEAIKVMKMGGWTTLDSMQVYIRHAGVDIKGITSVLKLHDPDPKVGKVLQFNPEL